MSVRDIFARAAKAAAPAFRTMDWEWTSRKSDDRYTPLEADIQGLLEQLYRGMGRDTIAAETGRLKVLRTRNEDGQVYETQLLLVLGTVDELYPENNR